MPMIDIYRTLIDREYTVTHSVVSDENGPTAVRFELTRTVDSIVTETYANEEPWQAETANGHTQIDGPTTVDTNADSVATRQAVVSTVEDILRDAKFDTLGDHLAGENYIQHKPRFPDGVSGLVAALTALAEKGVTMSYTGISHTVAEGDFGYTRSEGQFGGQPFIFHDLFRVIDGKCVEHWDVMVPAEA